MIAATNTGAVPATSGLLGGSRGGPRVPLPRVATRVTAMEWLVIGGLWLALAASSVTTLTDRARQAGISVVYRDFFVLQAMDWTAWMLLLWPLFRLLDAAPLQAPHRLRNLGLRLTIVLGIAAAHGALVFPVLGALWPTLGVGRELWRLQVVTPGGMFVDDLMNIGVPLLFYAALRRVHRRRIELARAADLERALLRARLHALDLELQPHFLFNTLNAVTALMRADPPQAERMLVTLGDLLRTTLGRTGEEITLREELDQLGLYLDIQRIRFGDRLEIREEVDAEVLDARVPAMLLQPLVENALSHGLAPKCGPGAVTISALVDADGVVLTVTDDGVGLPPGPARERVGVGNTRERLGALYGAAATFVLRGRAAGGAEAVVRLPLVLGAPGQRRPARTPAAALHRSGDVTSRSQRW